MIRKYVTGGLVGLTGGTTTLSLLGLELKGNGLVLLGLFLMGFIAVLIFWAMTLRSDRAERIIISLFGKKEEPEADNNSPEEILTEEEEEEEAPDP